MPYLAKCLLVLLFGACPFMATCQISPGVVILQPSVYQVVGDTVLVRVSVTPANPIDTIFVSKDGVRQATELVYDSTSGLFSGRISLTGLPDDTLSLYFMLIEKTYVKQSGAFTMIHHSLLPTIPGPAPQVVISAPLSYSVARPLIHLKARAISSTDSCRLRVSKAAPSFGSTYYSVIGEYLDSVDTDLDLSAYEGTGFYLIVEAIDKNNQTANSGAIPVFVESSPYLIPYFAAQSKILDFNYNKVLIADDGLIANPRIVDVSSGVSVAVPYTGQSIDYGYITPQGAVFSAAPMGAGYDSLYDFNSGSLYNLGKCSPGLMKAAGNYCMWQNADSIFLRDLVAGTNLLVASIAFGKADVTANGTVVYVDSSDNVTKYAGGSYTAITNYSYPPYWQYGLENPITDDHNIAYAYFEQTEDQLMVTGEQGFATTVMRGTLPLAGRDYQLNNKYIAYINNTDPVHAELRIRDSTTASTLIEASLVGGFQMDLLNSKGDLMYFSGGRKLAARGEPVIRISSFLGKAYYRDSSWYIAIGRILFRFTTDTLPARPLLEGAAGPYCHRQGIQKIKLLNLPDTTGGTTVDIRLDSTRLPLDGADSSIQFNPGDLSVGSHSLICTFKNEAGAVADSLHFIILAAVTPIVKISSDVKLVISTASPLTLTATNIAGGGTSPLYLFAKDKSFVKVLQAESSNNKLTILPAVLALGDNLIYVEMTTSDSCYTVQTSVDSIDIRRVLATGIVDGDYPGQLIGVNPNPFKGQITISGLSSEKTYWITLRPLSGQVLYSKEVIGQTTLDLYCPQVAAGVYLLSIYDETKNKKLGTVRLVKEQ